MAGRWIRHGGANASFHAAQRRGDSSSRVALNTRHDRHLSRGVRTIFDAASSWETASGLGEYEVNYGVHNVDEVE